MSTFELSEYQKRILDFIKYENGNLLVDAKAGSGKTSTLVLIADEIIKQNKKCLFLAFNKSIVEELKTKIISDSCQIKTLHSLGLSFLRSFLYKKHGENYVIDIDQHDEMIKQEVEKLFEVYCRQDFNIANAEMGSDDRDDLYYNLLREVASMVNYSRLYNCNYHEPEQLYDLAPKLCWYLKDYEDYGMKRFPEIVEKVIDGIKESFENPVKDEAGIPHYRVTYTDMIYFPCLYKMRPPFSLRTFLDYVLVDETQDLSVLQQMFIKLFVGYNTRMIAVGDEKQCQPKGTKVLMKDKTEKNIEDIKPGDKVIGYIHTSQETYFTDKEDIEVEDVQHLKASKLYKVTLENGLTSSYTYNHKCYVKIKDNFNEGYLVYLMRNNEGYYRVGKTKLYNKSCRMFGLRGRLRQENCQDAWIIEYCKTEQDAWILEQKISIKYGIPQLIFHKVCKEQRCDYDLVKNIHNYVGKDEIEKRAIKLLDDYNRNIEYPFLSLYDGKHIAHTHSFITQACNIIPELMDCIIYDENNKTIKSYKKSHQYLLKKVRATYMNIKSIEILKGDFDVYGLKVKRTENYVADGILTHNCIYGFAGADTKSIKNLKKNFDLTELPLNICYRCPKNVIKLAQDIVPSIDWNHKREDDGIVEFIDDSNLKDKLQPGDVILARRNNDLVRLYKKLVLDEKISIKFKNQEMVTTIVNEIKKVIKEYIKRYNAYANVEKELYRLCDEKGINWRKDDKHLSKTDKSFMQSKYKELVRQNKQTSKQICKSNYNIDYLKTCMDEYKEKGEYAFTYDGQKDNICVEYFDVIESLLEQYKQNESGILVNDFIVYTESFLKGNIYKEVPILSSIHMMKGGEADNVFIIDYPRFPYIYSNQTEDAQQQEKNLQYVALTRPKKNLYLCRISRCRNRETEEDIDRLNTKCEFDVRAALKRGEG